MSYSRKKCFSSVFKAQCVQYTQRALSRNRASTSTRLMHPRLPRSCFCFSGELSLCWSLKTRKNIHAHGPLTFCTHSFLFVLIFRTAKTIFFKVIQQQASYWRTSMLKYHTCSALSPTQERTDITKETSQREYKTQTHDEWPFSRMLWQQTGV